jgi:ElaB/YqjD/DUF883 family membrane-anchored ribosome-binding protein
MQQNQERDFKEQVSTTGGEIRDTAGRVATQARERVDEVSTKVRENVTNARDVAMEQIEQTHERAASGVESAAQQVREQTFGSGGIRETAGTKLADSMEKTAVYLREHDTKTMMADFEMYAKEHPTQAIMGAVAVGFILGRVLK